MQHAHMNELVKFDDPKSKLLHTVHMHATAHAQCAFKFDHAKSKLLGALRLFRRSDFGLNFLSTSQEDYFC